MKAILVNNRPSGCRAPELPIADDLLRNLCTTKLSLQGRRTVLLGSTSNQERDTSQPSSKVEVVLSGNLSADVSGIGQDSGDVVEDEGPDGFPGFVGLLEPCFFMILQSLFLVGI